jgi:hypothetical protein
MYKKYILTLITIIVLSSFINCKSKKIDTKEEITFQEKQTVDEKYNQDKSKLLILSYVFNRNPVITFNYRVIDTKTKKVLKKGVFVGEKIEWLDATTLKCTKHVGMIQKEEDHRLSPEKEKKTAMNYIIININ